jgi:hypothetical protein
VEGIRLEGDPTVPVTTWFNHLYLLLFRWKEVTILEVPPGVKSYRVGYIDEFGGAKYNTSLLASRRFAVRHGREACRFFAILPDGDRAPAQGGDTHSHRGAE